MFSQHYIPAPPLNQFVESLWLYEDCVQSNGLERILPTGSLSLIINLRHDSLRTYDRHDASRFETFNGALLAGARSTYTVIDTQCQESVFGVTFRPGGAFPFLRIPAGELHELDLPLDTLWKSEGANLRAQILDAPAAADKFQVMERWLLRQARGRFEHHPAVSFALKEMPNNSVSGLTAQLGISSRRFIEVFSQEVGLTPKLYCRVLRFQQAARRIREGKKIKWADLALSCGYFDQAHFVHDFREFAGMTPTVYAQLKTPYQNHVPLID